MHAPVEVRVAETLWGNAMAPEGLLALWRVADGARVRRGQALAEVLVEGARHEILAPATGRLAQVLQPQFVLQPGEVIGRIEAP